jgi:hypothetical protein
MSNKQMRGGAMNVAPNNKMPTSCYKDGGKAKKSVVAAIKKSQMKGKSSKSGKGC